MNIKNEKVMQDKELINISLDSETFKKLKEIADFKNESIEEIAF